MPLNPLYEQVEKVSSNRMTLQSYELGAQQYIDHTTAQVSDGFKDWIDATLAYLPPNAAIIEIGSAFGRDANYIESFGFQVERTDATAAFVAFLQQGGYSACLFNILIDDFSKPYDLVFANAVFLHFTPQELEKTLGKIQAALKTDGILSFSVKKGEGEEWTDAKLGHPRYFCYWNREKIVSLLQKAGVRVIFVSEDEKYLQIITKKK